MQNSIPRTKTCLYQRAVFVLRNAENGCGKLLLGTRLDDSVPLKFLAPHNGHIFFLHPASLVLSQKAPLEGLLRELSIAQLDTRNNSRVHRPLVPDF